MVVVVVGVWRGSRACLRPVESRSLNPTIPGLVSSDHDRLEPAVLRDAHNTRNVLDAHTCLTSMAERIRVRVCMFSFVQSRLGC